MTVSITSAFSGAYVGNGATTAFPYDFKALSAAEVRVLIDGIEVTTGFTVATGADGNGGTVTFAAAPSSASEIVIVSNPSFAQDVSFRNAGQFLPATHDAALDRAAVRDIYLKGEVERAIKVPFGATAADLPDPQDRAGKLLGFDAAGDLTLGGAGDFPEFIGPAGSVSINGLEIVRPQQFFETGDPDDGAMLNRMLAYMRANRCVGEAYGDWHTSVPLALDWQNLGFIGQECKSILDFGMCTITALNSMSVMLTLSNGYNAHYEGSLLLRGTNFTVDSNAQWTVDTLLKIIGHSGARMPDIECNGFSSYGVDVERNTPANAVRWGKVYGKRGCSGGSAAGLSRTGNWSGRVDGGALGGSYGVQYSELTLSSLPPAYLQGTLAGAPLHTLLLYIDGRHHQVQNLDVATSKVRIYPALKDSLGASGTFRWQYGGVLSFRGNDNNNNTFDVVSGNSVGCVLAMENLYGHQINYLHGEGVGTTLRLGSSPSSQVFGGDIGTLYCDGNTKNALFLSSATTEVTIQSPVSNATDWTLYENTFETKSGAEWYSKGRIPVSLGDSYGMHRPRRTKSSALAYANSTIDLNHSSAMDHEVLLTNYVLDNSNITLVAPGDFQFFGLGYTGTRRTIVGRGTNGRPTGTVTITPPAGHTINGGTVGAALVLAASTFSGPVTLDICYEPADPNINPGLAQANWHVRRASSPISGTATYDPPSIAAGSYVDTTVAVAGAALGDGANASFSLALGGLDLVAWVSAANTVTVRLRNPTGGAIDLASGTLTARLVR